MFKRLFLLIILVLGGFYAYKFGKMEKLAYWTYAYEAKDEIKDRQIKHIQKITAGSPAFHYAEDIWKASQYYHMDYRIILGLSLLESSHFRNVPVGCNNAFGLGIYGNKRICFNSYKENIFAVAKHWTLSGYFRNEKDIVLKGCIWQQGRARPCPYGYKLASIIKNYE
jgi:hypothetical protein